ncbi:MAG: protein translocase subunit SecF [Gammaproteobacteria bacterium]|nr:protein translocase subunit SecF [Gammaproteobacteria bacterium]
MPDFKFDFMGKRRIAAAVSGVLIIVSITGLAVQGLNRGLDFTGGALVEVGFEKPTDPEAVRVVLVTAGLRNGVVQTFGSQTELLIRMPPQPGVDQSTVGDRIQQILSDAYGDVDLRRSEFVGPAVGEELTENAGLAMLVALGVVMVYIMFRFTGKFAIGAVAALIHDVIIVLGAFAIFQWTFNLAELAAVLAVIGYSLNDTIVVSDRIRENFRLVRRGTVVDIINRSLNQTLGRTLITSLTTLMVLLALLIAGGELIRGFATALTIGVVVGTYSSIYVAASVLIAMGISKDDLIVPDKEALDDNVP